MTDKPEQQKPGVWNCTFEHIRDIGVVVTSEASKPETQAQGRMCSCIECVPDQPEPQAQATNEHTEQSERAELRSSLARVTHLLKDGDALGASLALSEVEKLIDALLAADKAGGEVVAWCAVMSSISDGHIWRWSRPVRTKHDAEAIVKQWSEYQSDVLEYVALPIYTRPQPQPVPDDVVKDAIPDAQTYCARQSPAWAVSREWMNGWNACRAAMLKEGK